MPIIFKITLTLLFIGLIGCIANALTARDRYDWRNHVYSTFPVVLAVLIIIPYAIYEIWK